MSWITILQKKLDGYVVKDSIWEEAFGKLGANDRSVSTGKHQATFKQIEEALNRKLTAHDFSFASLNFDGDVLNHLGISEYKKMLQLFTDENYQKESLEESDDEPNLPLMLMLSRKELQEEMERLQ